MNILHLSAVLLSIFKQTFCGVCFFGMIDANNFTDIGNPSRIDNHTEVKMCTMQYFFTRSIINIGFFPVEFKTSENVTAREFGVCDCSYVKEGGDSAVNATHIHIDRTYWLCCYKAPATGDLASALKVAQDFARSHKAEANSLWAEFKDYPYNYQDVIRKEDYFIPWMENKNNPRCKIEKGSSPKPSGGGTVSLVLLTLGLAYWYSKTE